MKSRALLGLTVARSTVARLVGLAIAIAVVVALLAVTIGGCGQEHDTGRQQQVVTQAAERVAAWLQEHVTHAKVTADDFVPVMDNLYDWAEIGLVRYDGRSFPDYLSLTEKYVRESWQGTDGFRKATDLERLALAISAAGGDARNVGSHDLIAALCNHSRFDTQGANSPIFGLIALDCKGYPVPEGATWTRERMLRLVLDHQHPDGSFSLTGEGAGDTDITAMAVQALWRYADDPEINYALDRSLAWLSQVRREDGGYASRGSVNSESAAQVIIALSCVGLDATSDAGFGRDGASPLSFLLAHQEPNGGFSHILGGGSDKVASEQAMLALVAWLRLKDGRATLYDFAGSKGGG
ncbi:MAG: prenyltransferase/squalene oxidase repeat-containing protein [Thermoleophilia bacterium]